MNRTPPQSIQTEETILGSCLLHAKAVNIAVQTLKADDFYSPANGVVFGAIFDLFNSGSQVDQITVCERIAQQGRAEMAGGLARVSSLTQTALGWQTIKDHCRIVKEKSVARKAIALASSMLESCYAGEPVRYVMDQFSAGFTALSGADRGKAESLAEITPRVMEHIENISLNGASYGLPTGFTDLDRRLSGMAKQDLIVIAARPAMGKTVLAVDIALNVAKQNKNVLMFSLEMSKEQICTRMLSNKAKVSGDAIRNGYLNDESFPRMRHAKGLLDALSVHIIDNPGLSITEIRSLSKLQHMKRPLDLIVVDYMQLSNAATGKSGNREREISMISGGLKGIAKELDIPVIALSQLNRGVDARTEKRPMLSDLRESGSIEQDADVVMFIYRDEVYNQSPDNPLRGIAEIITAKQRNGSTGKNKLIFQGEFSSFQNYTEEL